MTICDTSVPGMCMLQVTAVKETTWKADRTRSSVCGPMPIDQGETAGINMAGGDVAYKGNILHNITHFMNMDFIGFGDNRMHGRGPGIRYACQTDLYIRLVLDGKRIVGANILDNYRDQRHYEKLYAAAVCG